VHLHAESSAPFTLSCNKTPGWDTPWEPTRDFPTNDYSHFGMTGDRSDNESGDRSNSGKSRKKRFRAFILTNIYVPLVSAVLSTSHSVICITL
jgi:hypothetical protein